MKRLALMIALAVPAAAEAYCPCYTLSSSSNTYNCGIEAVNGTNPTLAQWQDIFSIVSKGPGAWGSDGPSVGNIGEGCGKPEPLQQVPARFPCELLKAIAMQESGWRQFCVPDTPADQVGGPSRTIISFDCGYGVGQVTSGMHTGETPAFNRTRVAGEALYNLATGASILAGKWRATNCVGDNQPEVLEHWYSATWAYNGLAYKNNPSNPNYSANRGVWNPKVGGGAPYQEKVLGWMEYPPSAQHWASVQVAYPKLADIGGGSAPPELPDPTCASPTNCANTRPLHVSGCLGDPPDAGTPPMDAGVLVDAGVVEDAGVIEDAGSDAWDSGRLPSDPWVEGLTSHTDSPHAMAQGCGCGASGSAATLALAALLAVAAAGRRRR